MYNWEKKIESKVVQKLLEDPNSLSSTMMINPENLNEYSPTLPAGFPKKLIPKEICENQMKSLLSCMLDLNFDNVECEEQQFKYYECKKWRDSLIFKRIKEWESSEFEKLDKRAKIDHLDLLKVKKIEYINKYENVENIPKNRHKKIRVSSDIEQINWRIKYLEGIYNSVNLDEKLNRKEFNVSV